MDVECHARMCSSDTQIKQCATTANGQLSIIGIIDRQCAGAISQNVDLTIPQSKYPGLGVMA
jgi:hypothetical protein